MEIFLRFKDDRDCDRDCDNREFWNRIRLRFGVDRFFASRLRFGPVEASGVFDSKSVAENYLAEIL